MAGEFRLPPHGIEYRVLSNAWLCHPLVMNMVFDLARKVVAFAQLGLMSQWKGSEEETILTIQTCDVAKAREIMDRNKEIYLQLFASCYGGKPENNTHTFDAFKNGIESIILNPHNIIKNWKIDERTWASHGGGIGKNWSTAKEYIKNNQKVA